MFLQYLWGIETKPELKKYLPTYQSFYSTYEELKPTSTACISHSSLLFLQYLWGIETYTWY